MKEDKMLSLAAAAEETSSHPLAVAILNEMKDRGLNIPKHQDTLIVVAKGMETKVGKDMIRVGSRKYMEENNISLEESQEVVRGILHRGEIIIYVARNEELIGVIGVSDLQEKILKRQSIV